MRARKSKKVERLNLIPILDAIFIFIFFLLMSAQFIDIYEIGSDAPLVATVKNDDKKKPLNLILEVNNKDIVIKTGVEQARFATVKKGELVELNKKLIELKRKHPQERSAIVKPTDDIKYQDVIKVVDHTREIKGASTIAVNKKPSKKLFDNIIFETQR